MNTTGRYEPFKADTTPTETKVVDERHTFFDDKNLSLDTIVKRAYSNAKNKGFHDKPKSFGDDIALIHSEVSEALEDYRNGKHPAVMWYEGEVQKPMGIPSELADVIIRIADVCGKYGIDIAAAVEAKLDYNETRPHLHGGKVL